MFDLDPSLCSLVTSKLFDQTILLHFSLWLFATVFAKTSKLINERIFMCDLRNILHHCNFWQYCIRLHAFKSTNHMHANNLNWSDKHQSKFPFSLKLMDKIEKVKLKMFWIFHLKCRICILHKIKINFPQVG